VIAAAPAMLRAQVPAAPDGSSSAAPVIVIDPGHPSENGVGARGNGVAEVTAAWEVAVRLRDQLHAAGYDVRMTKHAERQVVRNARRAQIANDARAALMVRLHCDVGNGTGFALYYPDRQGTAEGRTGPSAAVMARSRVAALALDSAMAAELSPRYLRNGGVLGDSRTFVGSRQGALTGSIFSRVPVVTVEMAVLTDASDARFISSPDGQRRMVRALAAGIARFAPMPRRSDEAPHASAGSSRPVVHRADRSSPPSRPGWGRAGEGSR
jgi:N-acetylmuramoyl-L-alanine amidase